jgi:hypothetical protein
MPPPDSPGLPVGTVHLDPSLHNQIPQEVALGKIPEWVTGHISLTDTRFLHNMILREKPDKVLEVGVASGYSTSVLLRALSCQHSHQAIGTAWLHSVDLLPHCYFAPERATGSAVHEIVPVLANRVSFHFGETAVAARNFGEVFPLAFVDGNHQNPWPVFDLLAIWPAMKAGSWVILHDIFLPVLEQGCQSNGPGLLFTLWPGEKLLQSPNHETRNVGAIRLPENQADALSALALLLKFAWECEGPDEKLQQQILLPYLS